MDNNQTNNPNVKTVVTKKVVTTLPAGMAKPIPVNSADAVNLAREEQLRKMAEQQEAMVNNQNNVVQEENIIINNQTDAVANFDNSVAQFNEVNDLVQVVEEKNNKLLIAIMALILTVIVIIIIAQLPMLFNL